MVNWNHFRTHSKPIRHAARMNDVRDVVLRVIAASGEGQTHLRILRRLSAPPDFLLSSNHILPILYQIIFEDIVILAVPKVIFNFCEIFDPYYSNSVEDALYMVLQAFEVGHFSIYIFEDLCTFDQGVAYLHRNLIGHQVSVGLTRDNTVFDNKSTGPVFEQFCCWMDALIDGGENLDNSTSGYTSLILKLLLIFRKTPWSPKDYVQNSLCQWTTILVMSLLRLQQCSRTALSG